MEFSTPQNRVIRDALKECEVKEEPTTHEQCVIDKLALPEPPEYNCGGIDGRTVPRVFQSDAPREGEVCKKD